MREILFRGKTKADGYWLHGDLVHLVYNEGLVFMFNGVGVLEEIDPETVGQFTGLTDKNGKKIFEGDILGDWGEDENREECFYSMGVVNYWEREGKYVLTDKNGYCNDWTLEDEGKPENWGKQIIIGNIHDNPELLEVKK